MELWEKMFFMRRSQLERIIEKYGRARLLREFVADLLRQNDEWALRLLQLLREEITLDEYFS